MNVLVWLMEGTWPATVDAARGASGPDDAITLLHVIDASAHGAYAGLMGRGGPVPDISAVSASAESRLLAAASSRLGRAAETAHRAGRLEREVVAACEGFDLLVVARDGDLHRVGPHSLAPPTRFVVDHAPCSVLLVWPAEPAVKQPPPPPPPSRHP
jgi:nucleotide-binding universal stress UspA family protein